MPEAGSVETQVTAAADDLARLVRRLRSLSPRAWQGRRDRIRMALAELVAIEAALEGRALAPPVVPDHVLADAIAVIGGEVLDQIAAGSRADVERFTQLINAVLSDTR